MIIPYEGAVEPFRIYGNCYFIGTIPASSHLIDTGEGLILIDPGFPQSLYLVLESIRELGFDPHDICYIINTHGHYDHLGATRALTEMTGAKTFLGRQDADYANGKVDLTWAEELGYRYEKHEFFQPDVLLDDGTVIALGNTEIRCRHTLGHTPGTMSFFLTLHGKRGDKAAGMRAFPWTAGDYTNGTGDEIYQDHQDWLMRDEKGGIYAYFKNFRVIDLSNKNFLAWYFKKLDALFAAGAGYVYMDMGGQASTNVNFAGRESRAGLFNQIPIFRYYHDHGVTCGIEGMNPLVIDNFWYREELYNPMGGKEFAVIGGNPSTHEDVSFVLRYFRMAMYGGFPRFYTDAYAQHFERCPDEIAMIDHIAALLPAINTALDFGMPFIRAAGCGTTWINEKGGAIFVWDNVKELQVVLPEDFAIVKTQLPDQKMRDFKPADLKNIPSETIFIIKRI